MVQHRPKVSPLLLLGILLIFFLVYFFIYNWPNLRKSFASVSVNIPVKQAVVYVAPKFGTSGGLLTASDIASKMQLVIYARNQMNGNLSGYLSAGYKGDALIYLLEDEIYGPSGLSSIASQSYLCTSAQKQVNVNSNNATMDTGDFCEIHDAIISHTALPDYPDIFPTENWFLHKSDGSRYVKSSGSSTIYRPNPGDANWREYFSRRALRELVNSDPNHPAVAGSMGLFIDNVDLSWTKVLSDGGAPKEYSSSNAYTNATVGFVSYVHSKLHSGVHNFPVWGNMISDPNTGTSWNIYSPSLEGGMAESFGLSYGGGPHSLQSTINELAQAESWISSGKDFLAVIQGNSSQAYNKYTLGLVLLVTDGVHASYKYANNSGSYGEYYEFPELNLALGAPLEAKRKMSDIPLVYARNFRCGSISVDLTNHTASFSTASCSGATNPPTPTLTLPPTPTHTPTPTTSHTPTPSPASTHTPTPLPTASSLIKVGDVNGDGLVNIVDIGIMIDNYGSSHPANPKADINKDNIVNIVDIGIVIDNYGK